MTREDFAEEVLAKIRGHINKFRDMLASWDGELGSGDQRQELFRIIWDLKDGTQIYTKLRLAPGVTRLLEETIGMRLREMSEAYARDYGTINMANKYPVAFEFPEENPETEQCRALYLLAESLLEESVLVT